MSEKLSSILSRDANNLDIFRIIAACMVIYGHSYALLPRPGHVDLVQRCLGFDYAGSLAVKIFFFISGLVVTNSLLKKNDALLYLISRFFRIWPALLTVLLVSAFVIGPVFSTLPLQRYLARGEVYAYVWKNLSLNMVYVLPGVFLNNPYKSAINGSLWTIYFEVGAYLVLLGLYLVGLFRYKSLAIALFLVMLVDPLLEKSFLFTWVSHTREITLLFPCFAFGSLLAYLKNELSLNFPCIFGSWLLFFIFRQATYSFYLFYLALFLSILWAAGTPLLRRLKLKDDISYGIYLWGWPVQQTLVKLFADKGILFNQLVSILFCLLIGYTSWMLIERRFIGFGARLYLKLTDRTMAWKLKSNEA